MHEVPFKGLARRASNHSVETHHIRQHVSRTQVLQLAEGSLTVAAGEEFALAFATLAEDATNGPQEPEFWASLLTDAGAHLAPIIATDIKTQNMAGTGRRADESRGGWISSSGTASGPLDVSLVIPCASDPMKYRGWLAVRVTVKRLGDSWKIDDYSATGYTGVDAGGGLSTLLRQRILVGPNWRPLARAS